MAPTDAAVGAGVSTSGLPRLLDLSSRRARGADDKSKWSGTVAVIVLHALAAVFGLVACVLVGQTGQHTALGNRGSVLLADGAVPGQLVFFFVLTLLVSLAFTCTSLADGGFFLGKSWPLTAAALGLGMAATGMCAGALAIAASALSGLCFAVVLLQLLCTAVALGSSIALALSILARSSVYQDLLSATAGTGGDP